MRCNTNPLPVMVQVVLASAALLAAGLGVPVMAQDQGQSAAPTGPLVETAFAMPRIEIPKSRDSWQGDEVGSFRPLDAADAARIREVFALQRSGQIEQAARLSRGLPDGPMLGEILADRYVSSDARPDQASLRRWLKRWDDLPDAGAIRHLLSDLSHGRTALPETVSEPTWKADQAAAAPPEEADPVEKVFERNPLLDRTVQARLAEGDGGARSALRLVAATRHIDPYYAATLYAEIARASLTSGNDNLALHAARIALQRSEGSIGLAAYVAGLASWRQGQVPQARVFFEQASRAPLTAASTRAGAAFWAARAHRRLHEETAWRAWMRRAAASSLTFYGMLAAHMLDQTAPQPVVAADDAVPDDRGAPAAGTPVLGEIDVQAVAATPEGWRTFALLQVGQSERAEQALRQLWPRVQDDPALCRSIMLVARAAGMDNLSTQLAAIRQVKDGEFRDTGHFPMPRLRPHRGFTVNPALVYALTRLESNFDSRAVSEAGAHGLMQIMPVTAQFVMGPSRSFRSSRALHDPAVNLEVGQRYLTYLAGQDKTRGDLIRLLASYNAGPNALAHWSDGRAEGSGGDPLLFIETLPARETRDFVHRALSYLWIYTARMNLPAPSLDTLAQGGWPRFDVEQKMAGAKP